MGKPAVYNWNVNAGDDEAVVFTFRDLTYNAGRVWTAQVRKQAGSSGTPDAECGVVASASGDGRQVVAVALTDAQTRALGDTKRASMAWDLQVVEAGNTTTVVAGDVPIRQDVTR